MELEPPTLPLLDNLLYLLSDRRPSTGCDTVQTKRLTETNLSHNESMKVGKSTVKMNKSLASHDPDVQEYGTATRHWNPVRRRRCCVRFAAVNSLP